MWKAATQEEKKKYVTLADEDQKRYQKEMKEWKEKQKQAKKEEKEDKVQSQFAYHA
jgi:hypothetical protein